ncbi:MAG: helix-turn-helix transcriptional regulator [Gammaproteobacteria bacterium]|nr:helix-turn-helix transcriptional regulator [Gammaproteobacteria bacterium]
MTEQLSLMVLVIALATGLVTSIVATTYIQKGQPVFFRYFLANILLFNLLILSGLVARYLQLTLQIPELRPYAGVLPGLLIIMAALKLGWLYVFILMNKALLADILPRNLPVTLARVGAVIFLVFSGLLITTWLKQVGGLQQYANIVFETIIIGGALVATTQLTWLAFKLPQKPRRNSILVFGAYHLCLMGIVLLVLIVGWLQPGPQRVAQLVMNGGFLILYNVFPLIWLRWFQPMQTASDSEKFELLGITRREKEIIGLIQAGMTNQEIADKLHISVATVKDHNHNIFKKCGTRNRLELARLFQ